MAVKVMYKDKREFVSLYLSLFNKSMNLTDAEFKVLVEIVLYYDELKDKVAEPFLSELVLSTERRKTIQKAVDVEESSFNNHVSSLRKKGIFGKDKNTLLPLLYPKNELLFEFVNTEESKQPFKEIIQEPKKEINENIKSSPKQISTLSDLPLIEDSDDIYETNEEPQEFDGSEFQYNDFVQKR